MLTGNLSQKSNGLAAPGLTRDGHSSKTNSKPHLPVCALLSLGPAQELGGKEHTGKEPQHLQLTGNEVIQGCWEQ